MVELMLLDSSLSFGCANCSVQKVSNPSEVVEGKIWKLPLSVTRVAENEYRKLKGTNDYRKFPEIIFADDVLWGQPRLEGSRLAVGDIVSHVDVNRSAAIAADDYELSLQQVRQALRYCSSLQCVKD